MWPIIIPVITSVCFFLTPAFSIAAQRVAAETVIDRITGDAIDLEIYPKPRKEGYSGQALRIAEVCLDAGGLKDIPAIRETRELLKEIGVPEKESRNAVRITFRLGDKSIARSWRPAPEQGYHLTIKPEGVLIRAIGAPGLYYGVLTLRQLCCRKDGKVYLREADIEDWPSVKYRGIKSLGKLEDYGRYKLNFGWSYVPLFPRIPDAHAKRLGEIDAKLKDIRKKRKSRAPSTYMALERKLEAEAIKIRKAIRESGEKRRASSASAVKAYTDRHAAVAISYNPGGLLSLTDDYMAKVKSTYRMYYEMGVRFFVISFDDMGARLAPETEKQFGSYARAQGHLLRELGSWIRGWDSANRFFLCHQRYSSGAAVARLTGKPHPLVSALVAEKLPKFMEMCWTGTGTLTRRLTVANVKTYEEIFGRPASLFYDNWPVVEPQHETGPFHGHDKDVGKTIDIHMLCRNRHQAGRIAITSGLDWSWNTEAYDPQRSNKVVAREWAKKFGKGSYPSLVAILEWNRTHSLKSITPDQAKKSPGELAALVDIDEAFFNKQLSALEPFLTKPADHDPRQSRKLYDDLKEATDKRIALFRSIVRMRRAMRTGSGVKRTGEITLDGKLDELTWRAAPPLNKFLTVGASNKPAEPQTACRIVYDDEYLYIGVTCQEPRVDAVQATGRSGWKIQHNDFLQIVLNRTADKRRGGFACTTILGQASMYSFGESWMQGFEVKIAKQEGSWTAEFKLPLEKVEPKLRPAPGRIWGFNIARRRQVKGEKSVLSSWNPAPSKSFTRSASYCGDLVFK